MDQGGHDGPELRVLSRYYKSLDVREDAILTSDTARIFDNSDVPFVPIASWDGKTLSLKAGFNEIPRWFLRTIVRLTDREVPVVALD